MELWMIYVPLMWVCVVLFMFRVLGQVYVALYAPRWLPPMREWYSGLLPYYLLLPAQLLIFALMAIVAYDYPTFPIWLNIPLSKSSAFFKPLSICETLAVGMAIITP